MQGKTDVMPLCQTKETVDIIGSGPPETKPGLYQAEAGSLYSPTLSLTDSLHHLSLSHMPTHTK